MWLEGKCFLTLTLYLTHRSKFWQLPFIGRDFNFVNSLLFLIRGFFKRCQRFFSFFLHSCWDPINEQLIESPVHFVEMHPLWLLKAGPLCSLCNNNLFFQECWSPMCSPGPLHWSLLHVHSQPLCPNYPSPGSCRANEVSFRAWFKWPHCCPKGWRLKDLWGSLCQPRAIHSASAALQPARLGRHWNWPSPLSSSPKGLSLLLAGSQLERKQRHFSTRFTPVTYQQCCLYSKAISSLLLLSHG